MPAIYGLDWMQVVNIKIELDWVCKMDPCPSPTLVYTIINKPRTVTCRWNRLDQRVAVDQQFLKSETRMVSLSFVDPRYKARQWIDRNWDYEANKTGNEDAVHSFRWSCLLLLTPFAERQKSAIQSFNISCTTAAKAANISALTMIGISKYMQGGPKK